MKRLDGLKIAMLVADGFEQSEMLQPRMALEKVGAHVTLISPEKKVVRSWLHGNWSDEFAVDLTLEQAHADKFTGLVLPGGVMNPDKLRLIPAAIAFIKKFVEASKPIGAICHGPWTLINAHGVKGRMMTSWPSLQVDLENAGATWVDKEVVIDRMLVTSRKPADIPAFNNALIKVFGEYAA